MVDEVNATAAYDADLFREAYTLSRTIFEGSQRTKATITIVRKLCESVLASDRPISSPKLVLLREAVMQWAAGLEAAVLCVRLLSQDSRGGPLPEWLLGTFLKSSRALQILVRELQAARKPGLAAELILRYGRENDCDLSQALPQSLLASVKDSVRAEGDVDLLQDLEQCGMPLY